MFSIGLLCICSCVWGGCQGVAMWLVFLAVARVSLGRR